MTANCQSNWLGGSMGRIGETPVPAVDADETANTPSLRFLYQCTALGERGSDRTRLELQDST